MTILIRLMALTHIKNDIHIIDSSFPLSYVDCKITLFVGMHDSCSTIWSSPSILLMSSCILMESFESQFLAGVLSVLPVSVTVWSGKFPFFDDTALFVTILLLVPVSLAMTLLPPLFFATILVPTGPHRKSFIMAASCLIPLAMHIHLPLSSFHDCCCGERSP